ncbi:poly(A) polymerase Pap [Polychaeton citri CBS 116435]|uniref:Poly(A) polymerase n=1 Tax=Polychaeton citri CBS 116435 TaxID=1314669 RepID=A0A9P4QGN4_9PEZI|nr:poly(A) polymerase Pap [Polychaeton citri CBS 116435]
MAQQTQQWGVSPPVSVEEPSKQDIELSDKLLAELKLQKNFETGKDQERRNEVLGILDKVTKDLVQLVGKKKGLPKAILQEAGGKIETYGSYRLGVISPGSDIDSLMLAPKHVTRDDFFDYVPDLLRKEFKPEEIKEMVSVRDAFVPIIKTDLRGVDVDIIFCSLQRPSVPNGLDYNDTSLLRGLSEVDLRCVNGIRVTTRMLTLVPQTKTFRMALRAVKLWAQQRGMYGNVSGFPGGVAWAMMLARAAQLWPNAAPSKLVERFFWLMTEWKWPSPIRLQKREEGDLSLPEWDPQTNYRDKYHLMPVITPAYPSMNSTNNVTSSTFKLIGAEVKRAHEIATAIGKGQRPWNALFQKHSFFTKDYKHYIIVIAASRSQEAHDKWSGFVNSRVRRLVGSIEKEQAASVDIAHPFPKATKRQHSCKSDEDIERVKDGSLNFQVEKSSMDPPTAQVQAAAETAAQGSDVTIQDAWSVKTPEMTADGAHVIYSSTFYIGIGLKPDARSLDISRPISMFRAECITNPVFDENMMSVRIKHVRNYDLPPDVFNEGETRPTRSKKGKGAKAAAQTANNKRTVSNANLDVCSKHCAKTNRRHREHHTLAATPQMAIAGIC